MAVCETCGSDAGEVARFCPSCGATIARARGASSDPLIGRVIAAKFRIDSLLGEGGMGMVYKATQVNLDKVVVLKVLRPSLMSDERTVERFKREARAASRLNHPNSIAVIDYGTASEDGSMYIAMEYCPGNDLHHILSREWPLEESRIIRIIGQVLSALAEAHANGVIHRDLKPENIMVETRRAETDFVKVLDFGIAKITDSTGEEGQALTRTGFVCGTPEYMSPEQAKGATVDLRSDLYAVGVILYQLISGLLPFDSESAVGFATAHLTQEVPPLRKRRPEARCSPGLERLTMRALSKDPALRPQSADDFRAELIGLPRAGSAYGGSASSAAPPTGYRPSIPEVTQVTDPTWNDRTPADGRAAQQTAVSVSPDLTATTPHARMNVAPARARAPRAVPPKPASRAPRIAVGLAALGFLGAGLFFFYENGFKLHATPPVLPVEASPSQAPEVHAPTRAVTALTPPFTLQSGDAGEELSLSQIAPDGDPPPAATDPAAARRHVEHAKDLEAQGKFPEALSYAQQAYRADPGNYEALHIIAEISSGPSASAQQRRAAPSWWRRYLAARRNLTEQDRSLVEARIKSLQAP